MKNNVLDYKNMINIHTIKKICKSENKQLLSKALNEPNYYECICVNLFFEDLEEVSDNLIKTLTSNLNKNFSNVSLLSLYSFLLKNDKVNKDIEKRYENFNSDIKNILTKELYLLLPILYKIAKIKDKYEIVAEVIEKINFLELMNDIGFLKTFISTLDLYTNIELKKKIFKNKDTLLLFKLLKKLNVEPLTKKDNILIEKLNIPIKNFYYLNYHTMIKSNNHFSNKENLVTLNYINYSILDKEDLNLEIMRIISMFSEENPILFQRLYEILPQVENERTFKFLIKNEYFSIYLVKNNLELLKNKNSKNLLDRDLNYCINQISKDNFNCIEDIEFFLDYIKDRKIHYTERFFDSLIEYNKINFKDIQLIKNTTYFSNKIEFYKDYINYIFINNSLEDFLKLKNNFDLNCFEKISMFPIDKIISNNNFYNKEFLNFYLEIIYYFKPSKYVDCLIKFLLKKELFKTMNYSNEYVFELIDELRNDDLLSNATFNQLLSMYKKDNKKAKIKELEMFIKDNIHKINWNNNIQYYLDNVDLDNEFSLMSIYFLLKKHNKLNKENLSFIENKIYSI